ncbi:Nicotinate phosphoribosyltransferase [Papilio machaon]|uniref:Nicotinate phosphoribosyltransferase n=1 Tax=Papilio machaon TaxID=76193 RepID=A0A194QT78_PAPMA|nr:Nicotinate phosphoribosyltransferase [Papilio machaon]
MSNHDLVTNRKMARQNGIVQPLLTDLYQITMAYAYWKSGKVNDVAVFDLFFRTNPFQGEFTIFAGLEECLKFLDNFHYSDSDIDYLIQTLPDNIEPEFFAYLKDLTCKDIKLSAIEEGSVVFPRVPLLRIEGPLIVAQLLETTLLTLVNFASLMATNAARYRMVAGKNVSLLEFGLRRAQGPDGGLSASKYAYVGGFDGTSNVLAGKMFNIPVKGTHAHSFVTSFSTLEDISSVTLRHADTQEQCDLLQLAVDWRRRISSIVDVSPEEASDGELAALVSYAIAFPTGFLALVDTYDVKRYTCPGPRINGHSGYNSNCGSNVDRITDSSGVRSAYGYSTVELTLRSGLLNFCAVALALNDCGYRAVGIRIDSGDLAYLSVLARSTFEQIAEAFKLKWSGLLNFCAVALALNDCGYRAVGIRIDSGDLAYLSVLARSTFEQIAEAFKLKWFAKLTIVASNDINEDTILSLNEQGHKIDCFGIGTHLVTCQRQPALGCVYKLVEINGQPRIKLSQDVGKVTIPGHKEAYRLFGADGHALIDLLQRSSEPAPIIGQKVLCRHPFQESKRAYVIPSKVEHLYKEYWSEGRICVRPKPLSEVRARVQASLRTLRQDIKRNLNPTPYKVRCQVAVSDDLYSFIHDLWLQNAPIGELS